MLRKLLKYDLLYMYRCLIIFYILSIVCALGTRFFDNMSDANIVVIITKVFSGATISMMCSIIFNNILRMWARYTVNLYGDESYLSHTLPVTKSNHYMSKFLASIISLISSVIVIVISLFIAYVESLEQLENFIDAFVYTGASAVDVVLLIFILITEMVHITQVGYTGIIIGNRKNNNKMIWSFLYGMFTYTVTQVVALIGVCSSALVNSDVKELLFNSYVTGGTVANLDETMKYLLYVAAVVYIILVASVYLVNNRVFNKGVNVD